MAKTYDCDNLSHLDEAVYKVFAAEGIAKFFPFAAKAGRSDLIALKSCAQGGNQFGRQTDFIAIIQRGAGEKSAEIGKRRVIPRLNSFIMAMMRSRGRTPRFMPRPIFQAGSANIVGAAGDAGDTAPARNARGQVVKIPRKIFTISPTRIGQNAQKMMRAEVQHMSHF